MEHVGIIALSLGERVARDGAFTSRRGPGEGSLPPRAMLLFIAPPPVSGSAASY